MIKKSNIYTYVLLSLTFIIVNLITLNNQVPWIDEVMFLDTSYNAAVHGSWETTAWYRVAGQYPFPTYPPLYQMLAAVWIWLLGGSLIAVRSLNLIITLILGAAILRLMKRHGLQLTPWTTALFTVLLWGTSEMAWMYRNGRPDLLCALVFVFTIQATRNYLLAKSAAARIAVIAASALLTCSGIQAAVYLCGIWLFFFVAMKEQRKVGIRLLGLLLTGIMLGMLLVALFMLAHGRLVAFACSIIQYSATLSSFALVVVPWAGMVLGFTPTPYIDKLLELSTAPGFRERFASIMEYSSYLILSAIALVAYITCFRNHSRNGLSWQGFLLLLCALYVPFIMNLAGRFPAYYRWMAFLPLLAAIMQVATRHRLWCSVFGVVAMLLSASGIRSMLPEGHWDYGNLRRFVQRQHFAPSDAVVCPFSLFYEIKPVCDTCYFVGVFPTEFLGRVDYVIEAADDDGLIADYVNGLKADTAVVLTAIDRCEHPSLTLYQVQTTHE